jgi:hypothetical protein
MGDLAEALHGQAVQWKQTEAHAELTVRDSGRAVSDQLHHSSSADCLG